jgi:eukaryotic-like serine/threonine-protein kinase
VRGWPAMSPQSQPRALNGCPDDGCAACRARERPWREVLARPSSPRWRPVVLVAAVCLLFAGADVVTWGKREPPGPETAAPHPEALPLTLVMGERHELEVPGVKRVAVGSPDLVEVRALGEERVRLEPLKPGTTYLRVWKRDGTRRDWRVSVRAP